ncbi:MAG: AmmeMemoRadiSam system radical SAM enzyme [Myxococcota bacterium]
MAPHVVRADHQTPLPNGKVRCDQCPRECEMKEGQRGFCFVREVRDGELVLTAHGRSTGFCVDPIEKKPLNHFLPGTPVLSFGTAGCNLGCKFCQNHEISKAREVERLSSVATPAQIAESAVAHGCRSVAFTYNDPVIFHEYVEDTATRCRELGVASVAVTAGYITERARESFFRNIDAANVDLKAFTPGFYRSLCAADIEPVLDTLRYLRHETDVWFEITTLLIPGHNDGEKEITELSEWVAHELGCDVPLHFSAFHPDHRMRDVPRTPPATLQRARAIARRTGLRFVYLGNVHDPAGQSTHCPSCDALLIERDWYALGHWGLDEFGSCLSCGHSVPGRFDGPPGAWGRRRLPVRPAS